MSDTPVNPFDDAEEIAKKSMVLFFLIDCSGSMGGSKIGTVNSVMEELIPEIRGHRRRGRGYQAGSPEVLRRL